MTPRLASSAPMPKPAPMAGRAVTMMVASSVSMKKAAATVSAMRLEALSVAAAGWALSFMRQV